MVGYLAKRAFVLLSSCATSAAIAVPAQADPVLPTHCGVERGGTDWVVQGGDPAFVDKFFIRIEVGDDDIRSGSAVSAVVVVKTLFTGKKSAIATLTSDPQPNGSVFSGTVQLERDENDQDTWAHPDGIESVEILYTSGQPDIFSTPDNWNMNSITVDYSLTGSTSRSPLLSGSGNPWLHRFKSDCDNTSGEGGPDWTVVRPGGRFR